MKKVTYEEWQKNPTPRMMWVWDYNEEDRQQRKVVYFLNSKDPYPIVTITADDSTSDIYMHCAEIEKKRRMTNKELSRWLREKATREYKYAERNADDEVFDDYIYSFYSYTERNADDEVFDGTLIREDDGEWREPFVEV